MDPYISVTWTAADILHLRPDATEDQANKFLEKYRDAIHQAMFDASVNKIETLLDLEDIG